MLEGSEQIIFHCIGLNKILLVFSILYFHVRIFFLQHSDNNIFSRLTL